ncbi:MAG: branched-chain amino acid ABC transporter permease [Thermodesulfobacteriota bacterium]
MNQKRWLFQVIVVGFILILPFIFQSAYSHHILVSSGIFILLSLGLNLIMGYTGQMPFGYPLFFGLGAYTTALGSTLLGTTFWHGLVAAPIVAGIFGFLIGYPCLRLRGPYFAIVTLAFAEIFGLILKNWVSLTRGSMGIPGISSPKIVIPGLIDFTFNREIKWYYLVVAICALYLLVNRSLIRSYVGEAWLAIRENEDLAEAVAVNTFKWKMVAFIVGAMMGGMAGCVYAHYYNIVSPDLVGLYYVTIAFNIVIIGGRGSLLGPVLGGILFTAVPEYLRASKDLRQVIFGVIMLLGIIFMPQGIMGVVNDIRDRWFRGR